MEVKVGSKGQIVIPKELREKYGIKENTLVRIIPTEEGILIKRKRDLIEVLKEIIEKKEIKKKYKLEKVNASNVYLEMEFEE